MRPTALILATSLLLLGSTASTQSPSEPIETPATISIPEAADLNGSITFRMCVRMPNALSDLPLIAGTKA
jgi:hypothetical protein